MRIVIIEVGPKKIENTYYLLPSGDILFVIGVFWVSWHGIWHLGQCATCGTRCDEKWVSGGWRFPSRSKYQVVR